MAINTAIITGRLTRDPELRYIQGSGNAVTNFTLAVDKQLPKDKREELEAKNEPTAEFIRITVWGKMAENCANYLAKGRLVGVQGRIQTSTYQTQSGETRNNFEVVANYVEFLEWGDKQEKKESVTDDFQDLYEPVGNDHIPF